MIRQVLIALLVIFPSVGLSNPLPDQPHIYVHGEGKVQFEPTAITIYLRYSSTAETAPVAKGELEARIASLLRAAQDHGIEESNITASSASVDPDVKYEDGTQIQAGVRVSRTINVTLHQLDAYSSFAQAAYETEPSSMSMSLGGAAEDRIAEAQRAAVADARRRATALADSLGMTLSGVHSLSEFDLRQEERYRLYPSTDIVSGIDRSVGLAVPSPSPGSGDTFLPGQITATATVYVVYLIEERP